MTYDVLETCSHEKAIVCILRVTLKLQRRQDNGHAGRASSDDVVRHYWRVF